MAASFSVNTAFKAQDKMSPVFKKMGKASSVFGSMLKANIAGAAIMKGIGALTNGLRTVTREFIEFEGALVSSGAKFSDVNAATVEGQKTLQELGMTARRVGATTIFSATEAAKGLDFLAMAGFNATEAMIALPEVTNLAVVAQTDLATATDIASDSLGAFGLDVEELTRLNDVMAKTMTTSNTNMEDMFEAIKKGAPAFTAAGQDLETFNALLGTMANSGVKGSEAGTALRNVMLRLAEPTTEAQKVLNQLGIVTQDQSGNFLDIIDIVGQFEQGLQGMGTAQRTAALATVFGARTVTGINLLLQEGSAELNRYRDSLLGAGGASEQMAGVIGQSLGNRLKGLKSALIEAGFTFVSVFQDQAGGTIDRLTEMVRNIDLTAFAERTAEILDEVLDNLPLIKAEFMAMIPVIKDFIADLKMIVETVADFLGMREQRKEEREQSRNLRYSASARQRAREAEMDAPNQREAEARQQTALIDLNVGLTKDLSFLGMESRGAPTVRTSMLGEN